MINHELHLKLRRDYERASSKGTDAFKAYLRNPHNPALKKRWQKIRKERITIENLLITLIKRWYGLPYLEARRQITYKKQDLNSYHELIKVIPPNQQDQK